MERCYQIFGKVVKLNTVKSVEGEILHKELSLYPTVNTSEIDLSINYVRKVETNDVLSSNPKINYLLANSFICKLGVTTVKFYFKDNQIKQIDFSIDHNLGFKSRYQKWKSMQFTTSYEDIGQLFHELILVPFALLSEDCSVVHSSGIANSRNEIVLFGGTGGVGKTSLEMTLCLDHNCSFYNDDISVIDSEGNCYPNFSYPKIYGYNLQGAEDLKRKIFKNLSPLNKAHYGLHSIKGLNKVRRRVQPEDFFGKVYNKPKKLSSLVLLFRSKVKKITLEVITAKKAAEFNSLIMGSEYNVFFDHLRWHEFNASSLKVNPFATYESVIQKNTTNLVKGVGILKNIYLAKIPMDIPNNEFKVQMVNELKDVGVL